MLYTDSNRQISRQSDERNRQTWHKIRSLIPRLFQKTGCFRAVSQQGRDGCCVESGWMPGPGSVIISSRLRIAGKILFLNCHLQLVSWFISVDCLSVSTVCLCRFFVSVHCLSVWTVCQCPLFVCVDFLSVSTVCQFTLFLCVDFLSLPTVCHCRLFVIVNCLFVLIFSQCPLFVCVDCLSVLTICQCPLFVSVNCLSVSTVYLCWLFVCLDYLSVSTVCLCWLFVSVDCFCRLPGKSLSDYLEKSPQNVQAVVYFRLLHENSPGLCCDSNLVFWMKEMCSKPTATTNCGKI